MGSLLALALLGGALGRGGAPFTVAIDAGHGGTNLGTDGEQGVYEKRVTLALARRLKRRLGAEPGVRVVMCRDADVLVPIRARVRCANESGARLFMSLHANASPPGPSRGTQRGFEVYVLPAADVVEEAESAALGRKADADAALAAMRVHAAAEDSLLAARRIEVRLGEALGQDADRGVKQAGAVLDVLRGVGVPAVLVEVGFLDHPEDGPLLTSSEGLDSIAAALARAVTDLRVREARGVSSMNAPMSPAPAKR